MRRVDLFMLVAAMSLLSACGTTVDVVGTYDEVWIATSDSLRDEASLRAGRAVPTPPGRASGQARMMIVPAAGGGELDFYAEVSPVGGEEVRKHQVRIFVNEKQIPGVQSSADLSHRQGAEDTQVRSSRRQDIEKRIASSIRSRVGRE